MNKKIIFIVSGVVLGIIAIGIALFLFLLSPVGNNNDPIIFTINKNESKLVILDNLKSAHLIKSKYAALAYIVISGKKNLQAGTYELSKDMKVSDIINAFTDGNIKEEKIPSVKITFEEGITLKKYLKKISDKTNLEYDQIIKEINDEKFLKELIKDYWFLDNAILNNDIYYALEGYLYPNTYEFFEDTNLNNVIRKMLDETDKKLKPLKGEIESSGRSIHEILTVASIVEKEAKFLDDREKVAQVIYKRLDINMALGMDVTSYYGVQKEFKDENGKQVALTQKDLNDKNPYNTRVLSFLGLPVGPICNPSLESIKSALNPADTNYIYFYADVATGRDHFTSSEKEFLEFKKIYG